MNESIKNPVTVIPWNGYSGAVTFTFDDAVESQAKNLDFLNDIPEAKVTFFACTKANYFGEGNTAKHLEFVSLGHEIGNHTVHHKNLTEAGVDFEFEIQEAAKTLRSMGLDVTSFATPYCTQNDAVKAVINKEHFISRSCDGVGICNWEVEPDWMEIPSNAWPEKDGSVSEFKKAIDQAVLGKWQIQLFHGVGGDWFVIAPEDLETLIRYVVDKNLWVATFSQVGAYYRAHFAIERAVCEETSAGTKISWELPHAHMPKSVPLRVRIRDLAGKKVFQKDLQILPNDDGSYIIEFREQELTIVC